MLKQCEEFVKDLEKAFKKTQKAKLPITLVIGVIEGYKQRLMLNNLVSGMVEEKLNDKG